jgi:hypothetical protein
VLWQGRKMLQEFMAAKVKQSWWIRENIWSSDTELMTSVWAVSGATLQVGILVMVKNHPCFVGSTQACSVNW